MERTQNVSRAEGVSLETLAQLLALTTSREPLDERLDGLLRFSERVTPDMRCSILLADLPRGVLRRCAAPSLPPSYTLAIDQLPIADGVGSCGTAAARREPVIVSDIARSPLWNGYVELAAQNGLGACWSVPLLDSAGVLLGTCAMYYEHPRVPTRAEEDSIRITGSLAALIIQRHRDAEQLRASEARYRLLAETCPDAVLVHRAGFIVYANGAAARLLKLPDAQSLLSRTLDRWVSPERLEDLLNHNEGMSAAALRRSDRTQVNVEIAASRMSMDGEAVTLMVCRDVTERMTLEDELLDAASREQAHLAHDLHDGLGQQLTGIALFTRALSNHIVPRFPEYAEDFAKINQLVSKSVDDTRRLARGMSPIALERWGLVGGLEVLAAQAKELYGLRMLLDIGALARMPIGNAAASHLYRIAQEALSNVARHAGASSVTMTAKLASSELQLTIADDGVGLSEVPPNRARAGGLGLRIMRYRAQRIGGTFRIDRNPSLGTVVHVSVPLPARAELGAAEINEPWKSARPSGLDGVS